MISKKTRIDKWNYYSNIYSVLCKYIASYGNEVRKMCDNNEIGFYFSLIKKKMDKHMNEGLKKYDLTKSQQDVLGYLHLRIRIQLFKEILRNIFIFRIPQLQGF